MANDQYISLKKNKMPVLVVYLCKYFRKTPVNSLSDIVGYIRRKNNRAEVAKLEMKIS